MDRAPRCRSWSAGCCTGWPNWMPRCATGYAKYDFQGVFQKLFHFCTVDLSALYFDIRKDALYCDAPASLTRRSARTVLDLLFHRLTTWLAPILVFTTEEVWLSRFPGEDQSVHLQDMPETPEGWRDEALAAKWASVRAGAPRGDGGAGGAAHGQGDRCRRWRPRPWCMSRIRRVLAALRVGRFRRALHHLRPVADRRSGAGRRRSACPTCRAWRWCSNWRTGEKCQRCWKILPDVSTHRASAHLRPVQRGSGMIRRAACDGPLGPLTLTERDGWIVALDWRERGAKARLCWTRRCASLTAISSADARRSTCRWLSAAG